MSDEGFWFTKESLDALLYRVYNEAYSRGRLDYALVNHPDSSNKNGTQELSLDRYRKSNIKKSLDDFDNQQ